MLGVFYFHIDFNCLYLYKMNIKDILADYFKLTPLQKDDLLVQLSEHYFREGIDLGLSSVEILNCFQPLIDEAIKNDDFEVAQAFMDIRNAIQIVLTERMKDNV